MTETDDDTTGTTEETKGNDPLVGRVFNERFRVLGLIARGGLGAVYRAEQAPLGRICAIKVLQPRYEETTPDEFNKRFFLEASIASKLTHPNNVTLYDYGHTRDDLYFMAMELLEGQTLAQTLRTEGPMSEERATHIGRQVCRALREAHSLGVIHRDIKPSNIFLTQKHDEPDFVKVMDFGLVKDINLQDDGLTKAGTFMGSPKYMSPEQIQGHEVDARTDIYAVGIVLFEMVTGRPPFDRRSSVQTLIAHLNEEVPTLKQAHAQCEVSPHMEQVIYRCIAKAPEDRFGSTDELLVALKGFSGAAATATISTVSGSYGSLAAPGASGTPPDHGATGSGHHVFTAGQTSSDGLTPGAVAAAREVEEKAKARRLVWGGVAAAAAVAAVGAGVFVWGQDNGSAKPKPAAEIPKPDVTSSASAASAPPPPASSSAEPATASAASAPAPEQPPLRVETTPSRAVVRLGHTKGKRLCDQTPCEIPRSKLPDGPTMLVIVKRGYVIESERIEGSEEELKVQLIRTGRNAPKPNKPDDGKKPAQPESYKKDPYG